MINLNHIFRLTALIKNCRRRKLCLKLVGIKLSCLGRPRYDLPPAAGVMQRCPLTAVTTFSLRGDEEEDKCGKEWEDRLCWSSWVKVSACSVSGYWCIPSPSMYCRRGELRRKLYVQGCSMGQRARRGVGRRNQITEREKGPFQAAGNRYVGQTERVKILKFANKLINKGLRSHP